MLWQYCQPFVKSIIFVAIDGKIIFGYFWSQRETHREKEREYFGSRKLSASRIFVMFIFRVKVSYASYNVNP